MYALYNRASHAVKTFFLALSDDVKKTLDTLLKGLYVPHMRDIGTDIATLRQGRGWTQAELARHINVDRRIIGSIETGQYPASARLLLAIERALDVPKGTLLVWVVRRELQKLGKKVEMTVEEICTMARES